MTRTIAILIAATTIAPSLCAAQQPSNRGDPPAGAHWVWGTNDRQLNQVACFRKPFQVRQPVKQATLRAWADFNRMAVYLNGLRIVEIEPYGQNVEVDVARFIELGENLLAVRGESCGGPAAVAVELTVVRNDDTHELVSTNGAWWAALGEKPGWHERPFIPEGWQPAVEFGALNSEAWSSSAGNVRINDLDDYTQWKQALGTNAAADPASFLVPSGFKLELLRTAEPDEGSWISLAFDPRGRLIVAKESQGLLRMTLPSKAGESIQVETINDTLKECRGLLWAFDSLYVDANESKGLYRLRDTDGDDRFDESTLLFASSGGGGHGRNDLALGPDNLLYVIHGDAVDLPRDCDDLTSPFCEHRRGGKAREGFVLRMDRDGQQRQIVATGLRNPYGIDFNTDGEMFTYDADAEHDMGSPWYRPTRVDHLVSGTDFGWRAVTGSWPPYYPDHPDNALPDLDIGKGSPTGVKFGTRSAFPPAHQRALYILDWAYGRIVAVHMTPRGASYACRAETFVKGKPLNVTDLDFGPDGALYFVTGGRKTQSGLYRVTYVGPPVAETAPTPQQTARTEHAAAARKLRRTLETLHGRQDPRAIETAWPYLDSPDPWIRYAARTAIEHQPLEAWQSRALDESRPTAALTALVALARSGDAGALANVAARLDHFPLERLTAEQQRLALYGYQLCLPQIKQNPSAIGNVVERLDRYFPHESYAINQWLSQLLIDLEAPRTIQRTVALLATAATQQEHLHYLFLLGRARAGWQPDDRQAFARGLAQAQRFQGGEGMPKFLRQIENDWLANIGEAERSQWVTALADKRPRADSRVIPAITRPLVKDWRLDDLASSLADAGHGRNFEKGQAAYAMLCLRCHRVGNDGAAVGPDLTAVSRRFSRRDLLESIIAPSKVIADQYRNVQITTADGRVVVGRIVPSVDFRSPLLRVATNLLDVDQVIEIPKSEIESNEVSDVSPMPQGMLNTLDRAEILDLLAYIEAAGERTSPAFGR